MSNNTLEDIEDETFVGLSLKYLDLSSNDLEDARFLSSKQQIDYLNLTFNEFQEIDTTLLEGTETDLWGEQFLLSVEVLNAFKGIITINLN